MSAIYDSFISTVERYVPGSLKPLWNHPAGPKTIFFWAPFGKWILVVAGLKDLQRPVDKISLAQSLALAGTGLIWSRYSLSIIPKNYSLFSVNLVVGLLGLYQVFRVLSHKPEPKMEDVPLE